MINAGEIDVTALASLKPRADLTGLQNLVECELMDEEATTIVNMRVAELIAEKEENSAKYSAKKARKEQKATKKATE